MSDRFPPLRWYFGTLRQWHWISSALCLVAMLLFALTGITLNHAGSIPASPTRLEIEAQLPAELLAQIATPAEARAPLSPPLRQWLANELDLHIAEARRMER